MVLETSLEIVYPGLSAANGTGRAQLGDSPEVRPAGTAAQRTTQHLAHKQDTCGAPLLRARGLGMASLGGSPSGPLARLQSRGWLWLHLPKAQRRQVGPPQDGPVVGGWSWRPRLRATWGPLCTEDPSCGVFAFSRVHDPREGAHRKPSASHECVSEAHAAMSRFLLFSRKEQLNPTCAQGRGIGAIFFFFFF